MSDTIQLTLHTHTRTEALFDQLAVLLQAAPPGPFEQVPFLIQGRGMERWLQQRLSERFGVVSQAEFLFPIHFFAQVAQAVGIELNERLLDRAHLRWRTEAVLRRADRLPLSEADRQLLTPHLENDRQRFLLATRLANLFDQYQIMRPDWLEAWQQGRAAAGLPHEGWQRAIWQALDLPHHRGTRWQALIDRLKQTDLPTDALPSQVFVFGISFMPTLMLEVLDALSRHVPVHLFVLTPTADFFGDLSGRHDFDPDDPFQDGPHHPLLVALGQQGRHFQNLLETLENQPGVFPVRQAPDGEVTGPPDDLIGRLQYDLQHNRITPDPIGQVNIEFHRCHTPLRELEVARDRIDALLKADPALTASDIVVMSPDIAAYRPYIADVFHDLPHSVADRSLALDNPAAQSLSQWLDLLADGSFTWEAVLAFISREDVAAGLGLDAETLDTLRRLLVERGQVRIGLDSDEHANTWQDGVRRLLLGAIMDEPNGLWWDWAPVNGISGQMLPQFTALIALLEEMRTQHRMGQRGPRPISDWLNALRRWNQLLYGAQPEHFQLIEQLLAELEEETALLETPELSLDTLALWADTLAKEKRASHGFLSHGITFCDLLPMRAIPVKVVLLLGMNDLSWPRPWHPPEYDLMAARFRPGDRNPRAEDRYTFLELLLGVRERLIVLWQGLSPDKNEPLPPAQVIVELRAVLESHYGIELDAHTFSHADRPFHSTYFVEDNPRGLPPGQQPRHYRLARALHEAPPPLPDLWAEPLPPLQLPDPLPLPELARLLDHPLRWLLEQHQVALNILHMPPAPRPKLSVNQPDLWQLREQHGCTNDTDIALLHRLQGEGRWPLEPVGSAAWAQLNRALSVSRHHFDSWRARMGNTCPPSEHLLTLDGCTLQFEDTVRHERGRLACIPHRLKGRHWLQAWLEHLAACCIEPTDTHLLHLHENRGRLLHLSSLPQESAKAALSQWLMLAQQAATEPLPLLADWLWAAVEASGDKNEVESKGQTAWKRAVRKSLGLDEGYGDYDPSDAILTTFAQDTPDQFLQAQIEPLWQTVAPLLETAVTHTRLEKEAHWQ